MDSSARFQPPGPLRAGWPKTAHRHCLSDVSPSARAGPLRVPNARAPVYHVRIRARDGQWVGGFLVLLEPDLQQALPAGRLDLGLGGPGFAPAAGPVAARAFSEAQAGREDLLGLWR